MDTNKNLDSILLYFKPPIFWKDKDVLKQQINHYSKKNLENLINKITETELQIKKDYQNSTKILLDFIFNQVKKVNN